MEYAAFAQYQVLTNVPIGTATTAALSLLRAAAPSTQQHVRTGRSQTYSYIDSIHRFYLVTKVLSLLCQVHLRRLDHAAQHPCRAPGRHPQESSSAVHDSATYIRLILLHPDKIVECAASCATLIPQSSTAGAYTSLSYQQPDCSPLPLSVYGTHLCLCALASNAINSLLLSLSLSLLSALPSTSPSSSMKCKLIPKLAAPDFVPNCSSLRLPVIHLHISSSPKR